MKVHEKYINGILYTVFTPDSKIEFKSIVAECKKNLGRGRIGANWFIFGYRGSEHTNINSVYIQNKQHAFLIQLVFS